MSLYVRAADLVEGKTYGVYPSYYYGAVCIVDSDLLLGVMV